MPTQPTPINAAPQDPLAELRNLHLPNSIETWPWAPGWYFLIMFLVIGISLAIYFYIKHKRNNLYKRQALTTLQNIKEHYAAEHNVQHSAQAISALLKQIALVHFPREKISLLSGHAWLDFLDKLSNSKHFTEGAGTLLGERLFKTLDGSENQELEELFTHCETLIKQLKTKKIKELQL